MLRIGFVLWLFAANALAQQVTPAIGVHSYAVHGIYEGEPMPDWTAEAALRDTVVQGGTGVHLAFRTRFDGSGWRYRFSAMWTPQDLRRITATWDGDTRDGSRRCDVTVAADSIIANGQRQVISGAPGPIVPEFAVGYVVSTMPLVVGDSLSLRSVRCALSSYALMIFDLRASVSEIEHKRNAHQQAEPAWLIKGGAAYPYELVVAQKDRMVLREVIPQGSVGLEIREYQATRDPQL